MTDLEFNPSRSDVESFLELQLRSVGLSQAEVADELAAAYSQLGISFSKVRNKYYSLNGKPVLRLAHNAQFTILLYWLARALSKSKPPHFADRVYWLLRVVSGVDLYYEVELPELWACDHPLGSVIGRGRFARSASLFFAQNCTIGNNRGAYPRVDGNLYMFSNSSLLGETRIAGNVVLANGTSVIDAGDLADCLVFGRSPDLVIKPLDAIRFLEISAFSV